MTETNRISPKNTWLSVPLLELSASRKLPGALYLCLSHKLVRYRNKDDMLDAELFNRLVYNQVKLVFIEEPDREAFRAWMEEAEASEANNAASIDAPEAAAIAAAAGDQRRAMMDLFSAPKDDKQVKAAVESSRKLVTEFMRKPFAVNNINLLQKYSKGCVDHSVNVSMLSVFLGLRMGYSHQLILENLALGGLFHDIGKMLIEHKDGAAMPGDDDPAMQQHPTLALEVLEKTKEVTNEVKMIVTQHHELLDGSGYPKKLKGLAVYDLARLVAIANLYDNLVTASKEPALKQRCAQALDKLESSYEGKLDAKKLEKACKILRYSLL